MKTPGVYIYSSAACHWLANDAGPPDLKPLLHTLWNKRFRRINHFIELALIGAKTCIDKSLLPIPSDCDVYLASEHGNVADVAKITETLFKQQEPPMPLDFLNVPNNMAGFYLAQSLGLNSSNLTVAHRAFAFETALDLAMFNIATSGKSDQCALVGNVEECAYPLTQHRQRLGLIDGTPLTEVSNWLYIGSNSREARASCKWVKFFSDLPSLQLFLQDAGLPTTTYLTGTGNINEEVLEQLASLLSTNNRYNNHNSSSQGDTSRGSTIDSFIVNHPGHCLLHINRDNKGRYAVICVLVAEINNVTNE